MAKQASCVVRSDQVDEGVFDALVQEIQANNPDWELPEFYGTLATVTVKVADIDNGESLEDEGMLGDDLYKRIAQLDPELREKLQELHGAYPAIPLNKLVLVLLWIAIDAEPETTKVELNLENRAAQWHLDNLD